MAAAFIQANTNGRLHPADEPSVEPVNRGFLYGDAIYEVWRTYQGVLFAWEEHFARLERSARALFLALPLTRGDLRAEVQRTVEAFRARTRFDGDLYIRLQVTRGGGPIGLDPALADQSDYVLLVQPCPTNSDRVLREGMVLSVAHTLRRNPVEALNPAWKTGNYLNNLLCLREAKTRGADDVVILNLRGEITEASTSNIAFVRGGDVFTPPLDAGILEGITRDALLHQVGPRAGIQIHEAIVRPNDLPRMEECFLLSSTKDITPVGRIDGVNYTIGDGTVTSRLKTAFAEHVRDYTAKHPEFRL